ncbi:hypothetical protein BHUM_05186 [Candidatus Burkholderia humilis]|nr:hypothetical protein BHUM_05186 [Candidatus Burkholderia humilis]
MVDIPIHELEAAINFWRDRSLSEGDEPCLCKEASALIVQREPSVPSDRLDAVARAAWEAYERFKNGFPD